MMWYFIVMGKSSKKNKRASEVIACGKNIQEKRYTSYDTLLSQKLPPHKTQQFKYYLAASIALVTFLVYFSSLQNDFVNYDDNIYVYENPYIRSFDLAMFKWAFSTFRYGNWHPITWISLALDYAIWGLNPLGYHLINITLHATNTFIVALLVAELLHAVKLFTIDDSYFTLIVVATTSLLFGLHPLHVESVAWVSERKDLLCALFFLLGIMTYMKYLNVTSNEGVQKKLTSRILNKWVLFAFGFFTLALLSKPMAVTLPVVLLILDWYPFKRISNFKSFVSVLFEKAHFIVLAFVSSTLTLLTQSGAVGTPPLSIRLLVAANSLIVYMYRMIVPLNLIPVYVYSMHKSHYYSLEYGFTAVLAITITITCLAAARREKVWLAVCYYYVITLLPVLGIVQVGIQSRADRYTYLPSLGPFLIVGLGVAWVLTRLLNAKKQGIISKISKFVIPAMAIIVMICMSYFTFKQIRIWKNGIVLWSYVIQEEPEKVPIAYVNRGSMFYRVGQLDKAIADFDKAIELNPMYLGVFLNWSYRAEAYFRRGLIFEKMGRLDRAAADFQEACYLRNEAGCKALLFISR